VANEKEPYVLIGLYESLYKEKYGKKPRLNKFREKWAMQDVIDSVGYERAKDLLIRIKRIVAYCERLQRRWWKAENEYRSRTIICRMQE